MKKDSISKKTKKEKRPKTSFKDLLVLFWTFFKIGLFTFGGGYAMIPLIEKEVSEKKKWISEKELLDIFAIAESTPGVIAVNTATFVGYKTRGFLGALFATIGVVLPSFIIIIAISFIYDAFKSNLYVSYAFLGIRACVVVLLFNACIKLSKNVEKTLFSLFILVAVFSLLLFLDVNAIYIILSTAILGIFYQYVIVDNILKKKNKKNKDNANNNNAENIQPKTNTDSSATIQSKTNNDYPNTENNIDNLKESENLMEPENVDILNENLGYNDIVKSTSNNTVSNTENSIKNDISKKILPNDKCNNTENSIIKTTNNHNISDENNKDNKSASFCDIAIDSDSKDIDSNEQDSFLCETTNAKNNVKKDIEDTKKDLTHSSDKKEDKR